VLIPQAISLPFNQFNINASTQQHINTVINTLTHQHINTSTHQHNTSTQSSTRQHINAVMNTSTHQHNHQHIHRSTHQHINTIINTPFRELLSKFIRIDISFLQICLKKSLPSKSAERFEALKSALHLNDPRPEIHYDLLFAQDREGNQGPFVECLRDQHVEEILEFIKEIGEGINQKVRYFSSPL
jgi:hypothetical protein